MLRLTWDSTPLANFIVFEGLDGAGTTTQARRLATTLTATFTCEPTDMATGALIRSLINQPQPVDPWTLALLFAADRHEHIHSPETGINALLAAGGTVVCDRYLFSSLAYQGSYAPAESVEWLNSTFPLPEHLIFIDTPRAEAERRMSARSQRDSLEDAAVQERVELRYREIISWFDRHSAVTVHWIDGAADTETIAAELVRRLVVN